MRRREITPTSTPKVRKPHGKPRGAARAWATGTGRGMDMRMGMGMDMGIAMDMGMRMGSHTRPEGGHNVRGGEACKTGHGPGYEHGHGHGYRNWDGPGNAHGYGHWNRKPHGPTQEATWSHNVAGTEAYLRGQRARHTCPHGKARGGAGGPGEKWRGQKSRRSWPTFPIRKEDHMKMGGRDKRAEG